MVLCARARLTGTTHTKKTWANDAEQAAATARIGKIFDRPAVPEIRESDIAELKRHFGSLANGYHWYARILAAVSYCAKRQGEGR